MKKTENDVILLLNPNPFREDEAHEIRNLLRLLEQEWTADYFKYIEKAARLGFDCLEIACTPLPSTPRQNSPTSGNAPPTTAFS